MLHCRLPPRAFPVCAFTLFLAIIPLISDSASPPPARAPLEVTTIVRSVGPAVVMIRAVKGNDDSIGSGFVLSADGIIVTNFHVVAGATEVQIRVTNGWVFSGLGIVGFDEEKDLALVKVAAPPLTQVSLGDSDALEPGERVVLIGNPQGLKNSVTDGLVSSVREVQNGTKVIQTTAPASPGSSGSPLLNMQGEVVGVLSFKHTGGENLNFAVASNHLREIATRKDLVSFASLVRTPPSTPSAERPPSAPEPSRPPAPSPVTDRPPPQVPLSPGEAYRFAYDSYVERRYEVAITGFTAFLRAFPMDARADWAQFWIGESYFNLQSYFMAIDAYATLLARFPGTGYGIRALGRLQEAYNWVGEPQKAARVLCDWSNARKDAPWAAQARRQGRCQ